MDPDKLLLHLAARGGAEALLPARLAVLGRRLCADLGRGARAQVLSRLRDDPFRSYTPGMRGFDATLDLRSSGAGPEGAALRAAVGGLGRELEDLVHLDLSAAMLGRDHEILPPPAVPIRYQYLMRRRRDLDGARYRKHYLEIHADFGRRTPGIRGYVQFHAEPELSRRVAAAAGVGQWDIQSVSELHLDSVEEFTSAIARWPDADEPARDEENFVDRANSVMFTCRVEELR